MTKNTSKTNETKWVGTWGCSQFAPLDESAAVELADSTIRQVIRISTGGEYFRLSFSNEYGKVPLEITSVHMAKPAENGKGTIDLSTDTMVAFDGKETITIPAGESITSDVIYYPAKPMEKIAVSMSFGSTPPLLELTFHEGSRSVVFCEKGKAVLQETMEPAIPNIGWFILSGAEVLSPDKNCSIVCFGDSLTDGYGVLLDEYQRWTDILAAELQSNPALSHLSVLNMGIGGNAIFGGKGGAAKDRFDRDVLQPGAGYLVFLIGTNDIGCEADQTLASRMIKEYEIMIKKADRHGIKVYGGTITPFYGHTHYSDLGEEIRQELNAWLRKQYQDGKMAGLIDFDEQFKDSGQSPPKILQDYNNDWLHLSSGGYEKMGHMVYNALANDIVPSKG